MYKYNKKYLALIVATLFLVVFLLSGQLTTGIFDNIKIALEKLVLFASLLLILSPFLFWGFGIYYCVKVAIRLNKNILIAFLIGAFLPVISIIIYYYFSFKNKKRKIKIKIIKIASSVIFLLLFISGGISYYFMGTPDSSLYSLREAIIRNDNAEFEKYFDIKSVAEKSGRSTFQIQEKINNLNDSIIEFKEENPDKNKDAIFYIPVELTGKEIKTATISYSQDSDWLSVTFNEQGKKLFSEITKKNIGKQIALFYDEQLVGAYDVFREIVDGESVPFEILQNKDSNENILIDEINEKIGWIAGFKIDEKIINGDFAKIKISRTISNEVFELEMIKAKGRRWKVIQANQISMLKNIEFPAPNGEKTTTFNWKYKGKEYSLDEKLYDSYYKFYNSLPDEIIFNGESVIEGLEKNNSLFINENENDKTIKELAQSIKSLGEENNLNENQIIELAATFVQTIPYDDKELEDINSGIFSKIDYPYEVLYKNTGICSDKSYLAYSLFKNLGYGVSFFEFPEDDHIAIGIKCPLEYSNYDSGYCFLETTSLENKIGSTPSFSKEFGIATSKIKLNDFSSDSTESKYNSLGKIEITNKIDGKTYTGIIETVAIQKEIDNLFNTVTKMDIELEAEGKDLDNQELELDRIVEKLYKLAESNNSSAYDDYDKLYSKYEKTLSDYEKDRKEFNSKIANRNQTNNKYNNLLNSFYK